MTPINAPPAALAINHLPRVEGHGNIVVDIWNGVVQQCQFAVVEAPRFIEAMLRGIPYAQAPRLASRICGICAVTHATAAIKAIESALEISPSLQTVRLRELMQCAEMLDSHLLHVSMLVLPDLLGAPSVMPLVADHPAIVHRALRMKQIAGHICTVVGARHTHPVAMAAGGFTQLPTAVQLHDLLRQLERIRLDIYETVNLFADLPLPDFVRETTYIALQEEGRYGYSGGSITSSSGERWPVSSYQDVVRELQVTHSTAKHAHHQQQPYMVGALARLNLNFDHLNPAAKAAAARLGLAAVCHNPYMISRAQVVEIVYFYEEAIRLITVLLQSGIQQEMLAEPARLSGEGVGACEAPRGTLYHHYTIRNGVIAEANCVIPTAQNLANIEADMRLLAPQIWGESRDKIALALEMLARAYDPCLSCATHMVEVRVRAPSAMATCCEACL